MMKMERVIKEAGKKEQDMAKANYQRATASEAMRVAGKMVTIMAQEESSTKMEELEKENGREIRLLGSTSTLTGMEKKLRQKIMAMASQIHLMKALNE
ncbi:hypothetical protein FGO68_gene909 [Halteria grandinella]|uniref:Uncharacterized protein n=1 Tax=Halteria grandinella TaxID=5974 RepID=A0A8J8T3W3_HALGN|nr:hypothetical protein FGO68_gene909 [Halteria grandinella]